MGKASHIQTSFNAGELSPSLEGRTDFQKYASGCRQLENFLPTVQGGVVKRSGTRFLKEVKDSSKETRLIPFEFSTTQGYILEFGHQYMRVYVHSAGGIPGVVLEPNPLTPTTTFAFTAISTGSPPQITTANPHPTTPDAFLRRTPSRRITERAAATGHWKFMAASGIS